MLYSEFFNIKNLVFLGEAGCGKSEIALNAAVSLAYQGGFPVRFFDLDQTKPLYRSRDARELLNEAGVELYHAEHHFDSPTIVGGVAESMTATNVHAILDVGGDEIGARIIGRFASQLNTENTAVYYVVNPYRPWSREIEAIDVTLTSILRVTRVKKIHVLCNPNLGAGTTARDVVEGYEKTKDMIAEHVPIEAVFAREEIFQEIQSETRVQPKLLPLRLYLKYEWLDEEVK